MDKAWSETKEFRFSLNQIEKVLRKTLAEIKKAKINWSPNGGKVIILLPEEKEFEAFLTSEYFCPYGACIEITYTGEGKITIKSVSLNSSLPNKESVKYLFDKIEKEFAKLTDSER
jgi:hypothetical protein